MKLQIVKWGNSAAIRLPVPLMGQMNVSVGDELDADLTSEAGALVLRKPAQKDVPDAAVAAIKFSLEAGDGLLFLHYWMHGDFDVIRKEWPDAPEDVFVDADTQYTPGMGLPRATVDAGLAHAPKAGMPVFDPSQNGTRTKS